MITLDEENRLNLVFKKYDDAIAALVDAAASPYSYEVYGAARRLAQRYRDIFPTCNGVNHRELNMITPDKDDDLYFKKFEDAIAALVDTAASQNVSRGPYSDQVYKAAHNVVKRCDDLMDYLSTPEIEL